MMTFTFGAFHKRLDKCSSLIKKMQLVLLPLFLMTLINSKQSSNFICSCLCPQIASNGKKDIKLLQFMVHGELYPFQVNKSDRTKQYIVKNNEKQHKYPKIRNNHI